MPSSTPIRQLVEDLRDRKSSIARKFDCVYGHCKDDPVKRDQLVKDLRNWAKGTPPTPAALPNLANYGLGTDCPHLPPNHHDPLTGGEKAHICDWPPTDRNKVINAMERALTTVGREIEFFWDLDDDLNLTATDPSKSEFKPPEAGNDLTDASGNPDPGGSGNIKVIFLTPRKKVTKPGFTYGDIELGI